MTGIINNNVQNQQPNIINADEGVNVQNRVNPEKNAPNDNARLRETYDGFEIFSLEDEIFSDDDPNFTMTASLSKKISNINTMVTSSIDSGRNDITLDQLFAYACSFSETKNESQEKTIFNNGNEAREIDSCVASNTRRLLKSNCFNNANLTEAQTSLKNELDTLIHNIISGNYNPQDKNTLLQNLNNLTERLTADVLSRDASQMSDAEKQKAGKFAADLKNKLTTVLNNQTSIKEQLVFLRGLTGNGRLANKIQLTSATDLIGLGHIISTDAQEVSKVFSIPEDNLDTVLDLVETGERSVADELIKNPDLNVGLQTFSKESKEKLETEISSIISANTEGKQKLDEADAKIAQLKNQGNTQKKISAENDKREMLVSDSAERMRQIMNLAGKASSRLTVEDSESLFSKPEFKPENLIRKELDIFKAYCSKLPSAATAEANIEKLKQPENMAMTMNLIREAGFSHTVLREILNNSSIIDLMTDLKNGAQLTDKQVQEKICQLSALLTDGDLYSDNTLLSAVLRSIPQDNLSKNAKVIMDHLPVTLNLVSDSLACIDYVKNENLKKQQGAQQVLQLQNDALKPSSVTFDDLKNAYHSVCKPDKQFKKFLTARKYDADLKNVETVLLRAAYHQYIVEHPSDPDNSKSFRDHNGFKNLIGLTDHAGQQEGTVGIGRYKNYDPMTINIKNTDMGAFLKNFNVMMHCSDFTEGCRKMPSVHLMERFGESLNVNMTEYLKNTGKENEFKSKKTHQERIDWMKQNQEGLTQQFINDNTRKIDEIKANNEADVQANSDLLKEVKFQELVDFANNKSTSVGDKTSVTTTDQVIGSLAKVKGSEGLAYLASAVNFIATTGIQSALQGQTFLGLRADDFLDVNNLGRIKDALRNASVTDMGSMQYKFAVLSYARMLKASVSNMQITNHTRLDQIKLSADAVRSAVNNIFDDLPADPGNKNYLQKINTGIEIEDFCNKQMRLNTYGRMRLLENLSVSSSMFNPENNIFVSSKDEGKNKRKAIENLISNTVKNLKRPDAPVNNIFYLLKQNFNAQLAGNRTADLANTVIVLSPFMARAFNSKDLNNPVETVENRMKGIFTSSHGRRLDIAKDNMMQSLRTHFGDHTNRMSDFLDHISTRQKADTTDALDLLNKNKLCQILLDKSMRNVAYNNKFQTLADMEFAFAHNKGGAGKTKEQLVNEVVKEMQKEINVDSSVLLKMVLGKIGSDSFFRDQVHSTLDIKGRLRYAGRAIRGSSFLNHIIGIGSSIINKITLFKDQRATYKEYDHISTSMLNSLRPGESVVHTKDNKFQVGVGFEIEKIRKKPLKASATADIMDNSKFAVKRNSDNTYTFAISSGFAAGLSASATFGGSATLEGNYGRTGGCTVTFKNQSEAIDFMSKVLAACVRQDDFEKASDITRQTKNSVKIGANVSVNAFQMDDIRKDQVTDKQPFEVSVSAGVGYSKDWTHEVTSNSHKFSTHKHFSAGVNFNASYSLFGQMVGSADSSKLSKPEQEEYDKNLKLNKQIDNLLKLAMNQKGLISKYLTTGLVDEMANKKFATQFEKTKWDKASSYDRYQQDPNRVIGELVRDQLLNHVAAPALKDVDTFTAFIGSKISGVKNIPELKKQILNFFEGLVAKLDKSNVRFSAGLNINGDTNNLVSVHAGANYNCDTVTSFETNLLQNQLLNASRTTTLLPEDKGKPQSMLTNNIKFLSSSMKELGCSEDQINKAVKKLHYLQKEKNAKITNFQIVRSAKQEALTNIKKSVKASKNQTDQFKSKVNNLSEKDFMPVKIVFNTKEKNVYSSNFELGGSYLITASISSKENMDVTNSYTVNL